MTFKHWSMLLFVFIMLLIGRQVPDSMTFRWRNRYRLDLLRLWAVPTAQAASPLARQDRVHVPWRLNLASWCDRLLHLYLGKHRAMALVQDIDLAARNPWPLLVRVWYCVPGRPRNRLAYRRIDLAFWVGTLGWTGLVLIVFQVYFEVRHVTVWVEINRRVLIVGLLILTVALIAWVAWSVIQRVRVVVDQLWWSSTIESKSVGWP